MPSDDCDDCDCAAARRSGSCCGLAVAVVSVLLFALSWDVVEPTEWGIVQNGFTGYVDLEPDHVYEGGQGIPHTSHPPITPYLPRPTAPCTPLRHPPSCPRTPQAAISSGSATRSSSSRDGL